MDDQSYTYSTDSKFTAKFRANESSDKTKNK